VTLAYRRSDIRHRLDGFGFVVPAVEKRTVLACTFSSVKFRNRAPDGLVLLRAFVGGALFPRAYESDDDAMAAAVEAELRQWIGLSGSRLWALVSRYPRSMPQYQVGHRERVARIEASVADLGNLALAGNAYTGAGIPDTIRCASEAAERLAAGMGLHAPGELGTITRGEARRA
jgi:oxygen-dependent protoporphyrinogen oxidase